MVAAVERRMGEGGRNRKKGEEENKKKKMFLLKFMFLLDIDFFIPFCQSRTLLVILHLFGLGNKLGIRNKGYFCKISIFLLFLFFCILFFFF